ncbi:exo-beta-N-acetylmuramidase NamZ family protein [Mucisphaera sp.]|uniref:exo-beta-N-acetylmuramidase NamZ family protein n=1 Tax=Mucisphaera sp. TaxID=2913024 RepID=UPI003D0CA573
MKPVVLLLLVMVLAGCESIGQVTYDEVVTTPVVLNGIDVLERDGFELLEGQRVAIVTNHTGLNRAGEHIVTLLNEAPNVDVMKLFSPEHGLYGELDEKVDHGVDPDTGLRVYSLYGETRIPTANMLEGVDTLVFDIQDIGTRFYTYISTMGLCMEAAKEHGVRVVVLDRVNPINGVDVSGPIADERHQGFTAYGPIPLRHGMTAGELAKLFNTEYGIGCDLTVVPVEGWRREMWFDETGQMWTNPSPNMRNLTQATLYAGIGLLESGRMISVGRGTDQPFEYFGAPFIDGVALAAALNERRIPGLRFVPMRFTPTVRHYKDQVCGGVYVMVMDREALEPVSAGMTIAWEIERLFPEAYDLDSVRRMIQDDAAMDELMTTVDPETIPGVWQAELAAFLPVRERYLMYR